MWGRILRGGVRPASGAICRHARRVCILILRCYCVNCCLGCYILTVLRASTSRLISQSYLLCRGLLFQNETLIISKKNNERLIDEWSVLCLTLKTDVVVLILWF